MSIGHALAGFTHRIRFLYGRDLTTTPGETPVSRHGLKALEVEALTYIYSPELDACREARAAWWRASLGGHAVMVGLTAVFGLLGALAWHFLPG